MYIPAFGRDVHRVSGYAPALPTPFDDRGNIDTAAFANFCEVQIGEGATALVVCGTTGEAPTLRPSEHHILVRAAVDVARGRVPVIAGAGSNSTTRAIELTKDAEAGGADAVLSVVPYYNRPIQSGLYAHFRAIAESTGLPIFLYDVPGRTRCRLADETVARLAELSQIIGIKDAAGDPGRPLRLRSHVGPDFRILSGDDATALAFIANGGHGCVSVTSNVAPGLCRAMYLAFRRGQFRTAQQLASPIAQLTAALFQETSPAPLEYALRSLGYMTSKVRLPLVEASNASRAAIAAALEQICKSHGDGMLPELALDGRAVRETVPV